ncbi:MAG: lipopolysaccharide assembly protein LapA domain-containing protein [Thermomicrobiales bacterium]
MTEPDSTLHHEDDTEVAVVAPAEPAPAVEPARHEKSATQKAQETALNAYRLVRLILLVLLGFVIALFVFRNWEDVAFDYVFGSADLPLAVVMLIFTAVGTLIGMLVYWFLARHNRN